MIKNERQYRITKAQADKFERALAHLDAHPEENGHLHPRLQQAEKEALHSQFVTLRQQMEDYTALHAGQRRSFHLDSFDELPNALIQARIAAGLSQKDLAARLGLKEQQIQRYEATDYASASFARVSAIIDALGLSVREEVLLSGPVS